MTASASSCASVELIRQCLYNHHHLTLEGDTMSHANRIGRFPGTSRLFRSGVLLSLLIAGLAPGASTAATTERQPAVEPGTEKIVFVRPMPTGAGDVDANIWIMDLDGSNALQLTTFTGEDSQPALSPDGTRISYISHRAGRDTLRVMDSDGTNDAELPLAGNHHDPIWSPDGNYLAYSNDQEDDWEIWVAEADGDNPLRVSSAHVGPSDQPAWSPDGQTLVYATEPNVNYSDIWTVTVAGTYQTQLTSAVNTYVSASQPAWSPDGTVIATINFSAHNTEGPYALNYAPVVIANIDPPAVNQLSWSGDGHWLVFSRNGQIWRASRDGATLLRLGSGAGWQPHTNAAALPEPFHQFLPQIYDAHCPLYYFDDFSNAASGWPIQDTGGVQY
jgi:dipeptidyl aminopeptidase/acylaminoacyl peptidase